MVYPEEGGEESFAPPAGGGFKARASYHLEGLIPLIIIIIIIAFLGSQFMFGWWNIPGIPGQEAPQMLIIGNPSFETKYVLDSAKDIVSYRIRDATSLERSPKEQLAQYDILMIDQSNQANKEISSQLGEAVEAWVKTGGKLIIVKDSGIYQKGAAEVVGWKATFGDIVPVECDILQNEQPSCTQLIPVVGRIYRQDYDHEIMEGVEVAPPQPELAMYLDTFDVTPTGNEIAYIQTVETPKFYPAIVEKNLIIGKSIYFNYDPGKTPAIFKKTIKYLS